MIEIASPAGAGLPTGHTGVLRAESASIPQTGIPVLVLLGPIAMRAALALTPEGILIRSLAPLVPSVRLRREEIIRIEIEDGHWYAFGRRVVGIHRVKGPAVRLMAPSVPGIPDGTENLGRLLRAWWQARRP